MNKRGFTLLELLVVIAIIGLIATIAVAFLDNARAQARDTRRLADINNLRDALELYYDENGNYPCSELDRGTEPNGAPTFLPDLLPDYLDRMIFDPINDDDQKLEYEYQSYKDEAGGECGQKAMLYWGVEGDAPELCTQAGFYRSHGNHCHGLIPANSMPSTCFDCADAINDHDGNDFNEYPSNCCIGGPNGSQLLDIGF